MSLDFENTSGIIGGNLYIGKNYGFTVNVTPLNAETNLEWKVEDSSIASISSNGNSATLTTRNYGKTKVIVTEKNSGLSKSYDFGTAVTDFQRIPERQAMVIQRLQWLLGKNINCITLAIQVMQQGFLEI